MSLPNIPDIKPIIKLKRSEVINLVIASIAMEEISLSHIMNAEAEKIQAILKLTPNISEILEVNRSVERSMRNVIKKQMLLQFKMEDIISYWRDGRNDSSPLKDDDEVEFDMEEEEDAEDSQDQFNTDDE